MSLHVAAHDQLGTKFSSYCLSDLQLDIVSNTPTWEMPQWGEGDNTAQDLQEDKARIILFMDTISNQMVWLGCWAASLHLKMKPLDYLALKSCLKIVKFCVNLSRFLGSSVRVISAISLSKHPASLCCWSAGCVDRIWAFRPLKICSLIRIRESIGLLKLHWLEHSSNKTISNKDFKISGNRLGHSAKCRAMLMVATEVGLSSIVMLLK